MSVGIVTDSVSDIPPALADELGIRIVPYKVHWGAATYKDGLDLSPTQFYERLARDPDLPRTSCPSSGEYAETFRSLSDEHSSVISLHITSKGSGAYQSACVARDMVPEVDVVPVDTCAVSMGTGYMAIEAARAARRGAGRDDVLAIIRGLMASVFQIYAADTLKYLYLGGRIGRAKHMVGSLLNLKPLITMDRDGVIGPVGQALSRQGILRRIVETAELWAGKGAQLKVAFVQGAAAEDIGRLKGMFQAEFRCHEIIDAEFGPALGVHTGPGTVGAAFFRVADE